MLAGWPPPAAALDKAKDSSNEKAKAPYPLSVPPLESPLIFRPAEGQGARPYWLEQSAPVQEGTYHVVCSDVHSSIHECRRSLEATVEKLFFDQMSKRLGGSAARHMLGLRREEIWRRCVGNDVYHEVADTPLGPLHRMYARVTFDRQLIDKLRARWHQWKHIERLPIVALSLGGLLAVVAISWGGLRWYNRRYKSWRQ